MQHSHSLLHSFSGFSHGLHLLHNVRSLALPNSYTRQSSPPMASLHFSVKDVTEIVTLMILILKLIAKVRKGIRYFRRGGWLQGGGDGTTNNKMGNESDDSIVASVEASTSAGKWRSSCI